MSLQGRSSRASGHAQSGQKPTGVNHHDSDDTPVKHRVRPPAVPLRSGCAVLRCRDVAGRNVWHAAVLLAACLGSGACASAKSASPALLPRDRSAGGVSARRLDASGPFLAHEMSVARAGDVLIENDHVRFYIAGRRDGDGYAQFPGWIEDAALASGIAADDYDGVDGYYPLVNQCLIAADDVAIESDGSDGVARISVSGPLVAAPVLAMHGARPRPFAARARLEYRLGRDDVALTIHTWVQNVGAAVEAVDIHDLVLFGDDEAEPFTVPGGFDARSELQAVSVVGSSHETGRASYAVYAERGPLTLVQGSSVANQIGGDGTLFGYTLAATALEPGATLEARRWLSIGSDVAAALAPRSARLGSASSTLAGDVLSAGVGVAGARIALYGDAALTSWITQAISDERGHFELAAPAGAYFALATGRTTGEWVVVPGVERLQAEGYAPSAATPVQLAPNATTELELQLGPPARARLDVRDADDRKVPAKVIFQAEDARPELHASAGERAPLGALGVRQIVWTPNGSAAVTLEAGVYTITASRGPSAELDVRRGVELRAGETTSLRLVVPSAVAHARYVAVDPHVHGVFSQHGEVTRSERLITAAAEGLDVHVATDHDVITDYAAALPDVALSAPLLSISGAELETENGDHCAWPLVRDPEAPLGGARRWWIDGDGLLAGYQHYAERGAIIQHVAHGTEHFRRAGYDVASGAVSHPELLPFGFNAMEVHNGGGGGGRSSLVPIWMSLINHGRRIAPLAASDAHGRIGVGVARTYVRVATPFDATSVAQATAGLHTVASTGPFIELSDASGRGPGDTATLSPDAVIELTLRVWAPSWMPIDEVRLIAGGSVLQRFDATTSPAVKRAPARALWFEHRVTVHPTTDEWYAVEVSGSKTLEPVYPGTRPWALTAPLFVDANGDGVMTP